MWALRACLSVWASFITIGGGAVFETKSVTLGSVHGVLGELSFREVRLKAGPQPGFCRDL